MQLAQYVISQQFQSESSTLGSATCQIKSLIKRHWKKRDVMGNLKECMRKFASFPQIIILAWTIQGALRKESVKRVQD